MKLLFYRYGSICEPDIIEGFEELGFEISEISHEMYNKSAATGRSLTARGSMILRFISIVRRK